MQFLCITRKMGSEDDSRRFKPKLLYLEVLVVEKIAMQLDEVDVEVEKHEI